MLQLVPLQECEEVTVTNEEKLGVMRIDWFDGRISNKWFPTDSFQMLCEEHEISIPILQEEINYIMLELLKDISSVIDLCMGNSYQHECTYYAQGKGVIKCQVQEILIDLSLKLVQKQVKYAQKIKIGSGELSEVMLVNHIVGEEIIN